MDKEFLKSVGKIWKAKELNSTVIKTNEISEFVDSICFFLTRSEPRSILVTGDKGVGKSTVIQLVSKQLNSQGWVIFSCSASDLMAGQRYIGDLELSIQKVLSELTSTKKVLWIVPNFHELYYGGRHEFSPVSILDHILPFVERGEIKLLSEADPFSLEKVIQNRPQVKDTFEIIRLDRLKKEASLAIAKEWMKQDDSNDFWSQFTDQDLNEVYAISDQYLSYKENPGRLIDLLKQTKKLVQSGKEANRKIRLIDFISSVSNITGLPKNILDDEEKLDLEGLRTHFGKKVIGQEDAVDTIIDRIAMIKAGLTDPSKPFGVFLFVGPTGTGKTEIAKTFAEYLFGGSERLIRLDMSEFQTQESTYKIFGDSSDISESTALVNAIRRKPFSIILLDEFEKAHSNVWDLFLQVFDDGRLTDQKGAVADFRNSIIILTSNIGASVPTSKTLGFTKTGEENLDSNVLNSINQTFRPEFINRLDKIVVFNPLTKSIAKSILKNELKMILERRGLRQRDWEMDFEDSALEFLLKKGFSSTLGARPIKRAVEKYLLAPLAITIVNHNFPSGNQFLLVSAGKQKLKVQFVDPDEPDYTWEQKKEIVLKQEIKSESLKLKEVVLDSRGVLSEFKTIKRELHELDSLFHKENLAKTKTKLLSTMSANEFWTRDDRYELLSKIEYIDRFESVKDTASRLFERLNNPEKERLNYDPKLLKKLAQKVYLLSESLTSYFKSETQDAILAIEYDKANEEFGKTIEAMYKSWSKSRGMSLKKIYEPSDDSESRTIYSVIGFAAYAILNKEMGYHVLETQTLDKKNLVKKRIKVAILPMQLEDHRSEDYSKINDKLNHLTSLKNVRRYRLGKSPLIKDLQKGWQTGKIEYVLRGDFDLF